MLTAMVWGASGGIGRAVVDELQANNWSVVAIGRGDDDQHSSAACTLTADVADPFSVQRAIQAAAFEVEDVALWVYAAGDIASASVEEMTPALWNRILSANLTGAFHTTHYSLPLLSRDAHLVFVGAISERLRLPKLAAYAAAKAGLEAFAETLRKEQRQRRVSVLRPAAVATPLWNKVPLSMPKNAQLPAKVATHILAAYHEGHSGVLDIA